MYAAVMHMIIVEAIHNHAPTINTGMLAIRQGRFTCCECVLPRRCVSSVAAGVDTVTQLLINVSAM
jgi:hypothetical protein